MRIPHPPLSKTHRNHILGAPLKFDPLGDGHSLYDAKVNIQPREYTTKSTTYLLALLVTSTPKSTHPNTARPSSPVVAMLL